MDLGVVDEEPGRGGVVVGADPVRLVGTIRAGSVGMNADVALAGIVVRVSDAVIEPGVELDGDAVRHAVVANQASSATELGGAAVLDDECEPVGTVAPPRGRAELELERGLEVAGDDRLFGGVPGPPRAADGRGQP